MIKAVIIGFSHMHVNEMALYIKEQPEFSLEAIADIDSDAEKIPAFRYTPEWNRDNVSKNYCDNVYDDYKEMLFKVKPDIAFILCENYKKLEVIEECAKRGVNICVEKPLALTYEEALKIEEISKKYNVEIVINWPVLWRPYLHKMKKAIDSGICGKPIKMRYINGHTGPLGKGAKHRGVSENAEEMSDTDRSKTWWHQEKYGGGVFLDICCYGCLFCKWFMGDGEESILSYGANLNTDFGDTDDNFAAIVKYPGKMSIIEGTWTTPRAVIPSGPMVMCTDGVIMCTGGAEDAPDVKAYDIYGNELEIEDVNLGESYKNMAWHYAEHIKTGKPVHEMLTLEGNIKVMAILDAAIKSSKNGKEEKINA